MSRSFMFDSAVASFALGELRWDDDDIAVMLVGDGYEPDQQADASRDDLVRWEIGASGSYRAGGQELGGRQVTRSSLGGEIRLEANSLSWQDVTAEFRYAVTYSRTSGALVCYSDMGLQRVTSAAVNLSYGDEGVAAFMVATATGV